MLGNEKDMLELYNGQLEGSYHDWLVATKNCTHVIHVASPMVNPSNPNVSIGGSIQSGVKNLLDACKENGVSRFIYTSTSETLYGPDLSRASSFSEQSWAQPSGKTEWVQAKKATKKMVLEY